ncbi:MAG: hypothetical protein DRJ14_03000 [Acidobacteria bacterium]|nr:MAG: hypothetical protein DRJ14_03000 [Acidobacteriota bacterium]
MKIKGLSRHLSSIVELELKLGNIVLRIDEPRGTRCPMAVVFSQPLHFYEIKNQLILDKAVERWENRDAHYDIEAGVVCRETGHTVAGPFRW